MNKIVWFFLLATPGEFVLGLIMAACVIRFVFDIIFKRGEK